MNTPSRLRFDRLDALRGLAMVWMALFHFCFDLSYLGYWPQDFRADPFWTQQRTAIVSLFLFCAGLGQAVALQQGQGGVNRSLKPSRTSNDNAALRPRFLWRVA